MIHYFLRVHHNGKVECTTCQYRTANIGQIEGMIKMGFDDNLRTAYHKRLYDCKIAGVTIPRPKK